MENVVIFYDHLEYFMSIWHNVWQFGIDCGHLVYISHFGMFGPRQIWQPCWRRKHVSSSNLNLKSLIEFKNVCSSK
jgi:hypothetical protein